MANNGNINTPTLFLIFNRPEFTKQAFERIRAVRPGRLFIAADGPRNEREGEEILCSETRRITETIDWKCSVHRLYRDDNLGCKAAVSGAISWFFDHVESGIILEDDCLPDESFFRYCGELLEFYKNDPSILSIGGHNLGYTGTSGYSYGFTRYMNMWGWATWADRAQQIDYKASRWSERAYRRKIRVNISRDFHPILRHDPGWWRYWQEKFDSVWTGEFDTWDYQWVMHGLANNMRSIFPMVNLVRNIGFGTAASHTFDKESLIAKVPAIPIAFPINHPPVKLVDKKYEFECIRKKWCGIYYGFRHGFLEPYIKMTRQAKRRVAQKIKQCIKISNIFTLIFTLNVLYYKITTFINSSEISKSIVISEPIHMA